MDHTQGDDLGRSCPAFMIVGTGRCGSTLLQAMLIGHGQVSIPYETKFFFQLDPVAFGFDDPIAHNDVEAYLEQVRVHCSLGVLESDPELLDRYFDVVRNGMRDAKSLLRWVVTAGVNDETKTCIGEKTPGHWMKIERILELNPSCKLIHLVRDPRDVTEALLRMDWWEERTMYGTARHCQKTLRACLQWDEELGSDRHLWVRFEDLLGDPRVVLVRICAFLDLEFDDGMLEYEGSSTKDTNPNNEAWMMGSTQAIDPSRLGKYREKLTRGQIRIIESAVGYGLMESFGYAVDSSGLDRVLAAGSKIRLGFARFVSKQINSVTRRF